MVRRALTIYGAISLVLSVALILGAVAMFQSIMSYRNPYPVRQDFAASGHGPALTQHVVLVVVDGLRADTAQTMRAFRPDPGATYRSGTLAVSLPSYSLPTWTVIGTGTTQAVNGVVMNGHRQAAISNIFAKAKAAGLRTAMVGGVSWDNLYGQWLDEKEIFPGEPAEAEIADRAADMAASAALTLAYFPRTDEMGHTFGAASQQYTDAAQTIDAALLRLLTRVDLTTTTVIITADHGQITTGGHGGPEADAITAPLIFYGAAIARGPAIAGRQVDLAPTVAALLGTGYPDFVQGEPLLDAITCTPIERDLILTAWAAQVEKGTVALLPTLDATVRPVTTTNPRQRAEAYLDQYNAAVSRAAAADTWNAERLVAFAATMIGAFLISLSLRRHTTRGAVLGSVAGLAAAAAAASVGSLRPTFSVLESPQQVVLTLAGYATIGVAVTLLLMLAAKRRGQPVLFRHWAFSMVQVQIVVFGLALAMYVLRGPALISGYMPDFTYWLLKVYVSAYAAIGNVVLLLGLQPVWLISRWAARSTIDSPTLIAPLPGDGQQP